MSKTAVFLLDLPNHCECLGLVWEPSVKLLTTDLGEMLFTDAQASKLQLRKGLRLGGCGDKIWSKNESFECLKAIIPQRFKAKTHTYTHITMKTSGSDTGSVCLNHQVEEDHSGLTGERTELTSSLQAQCLSLKKIKNKKSSFKVTAGSVMVWASSVTLLSALTAAPPPSPKAKKKAAITLTKRPRWVTVLWFTLAAQTIFSCYIHL